MFRDFSGVAGRALVSGILVSLALVAVVLMLSRSASAMELSLDAGVGTGAATRVGLAFPTKWEWLKLEGGLLSAKDGIIVDVTPMLTYGKKWYVEGGIGLAAQSGENLGGRSQSGSLLFHDVVGVGYHFQKNWTVGVRAEHYSNGGSINPLFGTSSNGGYTWFMLHTGYQF